MKYSHKSQFTPSCSYSFFCSRLGPHDNIFLHVQVLFFFFPQWVCGCHGTWSHGPETAHTVLSSSCWGLWGRGHVCCCLSCRQLPCSGARQLPHGWIHICWARRCHLSWEGSCYLKGNGQNFTGQPCRRAGLATVGFYQGYKPHLWFCRHPINMQCFL